MTTPQGPDDREPGSYASGHGGHPGYAASPADASASAGPGGAAEAADAAPAERPGDERATSGTDPEPERQERQERQERAERPDGTPGTSPAADPAPAPRDEDRADARAAGREAGYGDPRERHGAAGPAADAPTVATPAPPVTAAAAAAGATGTATKPWDRDADAAPGPAPAQPAAKAAPKKNPAAAQPLKSGKTRRARLVVRRIDPWSVLKFSLLFSLCLLIVFVVAVAALYYALDSLGVFESVNQFVRDVTQAGPEGRPTGGFDVTFSPSKVIGGAAVIGAINVVIITAISTLGAFLYNLCSDIVGGIEVTLAERE